MSQGANYAQIASLRSAFNKMPHKLVKGYGVPHQNDRIIMARAISLVQKRTLTRQRPHSLCDAAVSTFYNAFSQNNWVYNSLFEHLKNITTIIYCTLLGYIFILFIVSVHKAQKPHSGPRPGGLAHPVTPVSPVRLNNDAGSAPHGPRQMAGSSLWSPPWPRSPPLLSVHLHPNTPIIFIPATPSTRRCAKNPSPNPPSHVNRGENEPFRFCWCVSHHAEDYIPPAKNTWYTMMEMEKNTQVKDNFIHFFKSLSAD